MHLPSTLRRLALLGLAVGLPLTHALEPANPKTQPEARAILNYFESLAKKPDHRIISGQFSDFGKGAGLKLVQEVFEKTGHYPGLLGADYADFGTGGLDWHVPNQAVVDYWNQGGLVTISAHRFQ